MSVKYNELHVDEKYAKILLPNLYFNSWLVPGVTCTDEYEEGPAGGIFVRKLISTAIEGPGVPGRDFTDEVSADELIPIVLNNNYQKSKKIYGVQAAAVAFDVGNAQLANAVSETKECNEQSALACLITEGTAVPGAAITAETVKKELLASRTSISKKKGKAKIVLCSPDFYSIILEAAGSQFTPVFNDKIAVEGKVGDWLGYRFIETNGLAEDTIAPTYYDHTGTLKTVDVATLGTVDYIMYDPAVFPVIRNFEMARIVDSENFAGSKAQVELNAGMRVLETDLVCVRTHE